MRLVSCYWVKPSLLSLPTEEGGIRRMEVARRDETKPFEHDETKPFASFPYISRHEKACVCAEALSRIMPPTLLRWEFEGGKEGSPEAARRGEQRAYSGDVVVDDYFGQGKLQSMAGGQLSIIFDGDEEALPRTSGHVYALASSVE